MAIFGDEDNMVERVVEIDARVFLDGTLTSRRVFQLTGPGTRGFPRYSWRFRVLTKGLTRRMGAPLLLPLVRAHYPPSLDPMEVCWNEWF